MLKTTRSELPYGIVFGYKPHACKKTYISVFRVEKDALIADGPDSRHAESKEAPDQLKDFWGEFTRVWNLINEGVLTYHNGFEDQQCDFHGHHWHFVGDLKSHPTRSARWGRNMLAFSKASADAVFFACEQARDAHALARHVQTHPRVLIASRGDKYISRAPAASTSLTADVEEETSNSGDPDRVVMANMRAKLRQDPTYFKINFLTEVMNKYRTPDINVLKKNLLVTPDEWQQYRELQASSNFDSVVKKAQELFRTTHCHRPFDDMMRKLDTAIYSKYVTNCPSSVLSQKDTPHIMNAWFKHQGIERTKFMDDLFDVLTKRLPKKNTFVLQGEPNSGKSFVLRSLLPFFMYFAEVRGGSGYNFMWQDCIDVSVIFAEEIMVTPEVVEQAKLVFEGAPTYVHVKMRSDALLERTPVLITTNSDPWRWCNREMSALKARMFHYYTRRYPAMKDWKKSPNPMYWRWQYFEYCKRNTQKWAEEAAELRNAVLLESPECPNGDSAVVKETPTNPITITTPGAPKKPSPKPKMPRKRLFGEAKSDLDKAYDKAWAKAGCAQPMTAAESALYKSDDATTDAETLSPLILVPSKQPRRVECITIESSETETEKDYFPDGQQLPPTPEKEVEVATTELDISLD